MTDNQDGAVAIRKYRIRKNGARGQVISLPQMWLDELGLVAGDEVIIYRRALSDDLIVRAERKNKAIEK
jgi:bifunctional DNA-binding transcriptional regulator/antitoxin component of YhaV-PrlF toxin-antitoxin module